ncbi:MAG: FxsA family protein [Alphaproteobacteria bacterium]
MPFLLLFVVIPLIEIMIFMAVSNVIGLGTSLLMALFTAIIGGAIVRYQGIQTLMTAQGSMQKGILPSKELFDGLCLVAAGATLLTPGFLTDAIGFALLIPAVRDFARENLSRSGRFEVSGFSSQYADAHAQHENPNNGPYSDPYDYQNSSIIDGEYERIDEDSENKNKGTGT